MGGQRTPPWPETREVEEKRARGNKRRNILRLSTLDCWARSIWRQLLLPNFQESQHGTSVTESCPLQRRRCLSILASLNPMWTNHLSCVIILFCAGHLMKLSMFALFICVNTSCTWCHFVTERTFGNFHGRRKRRIAVQIYLRCRRRL